MTRLCSGCYIHSIHIEVEDCIIVYISHSETPEYKIISNKLPNSFLSDKTKCVAYCIGYYSSKYTSITITDLYNNSDIPRQGTILLGWFCYYAKTTSNNKLRTILLDDATGISDPTNNIYYRLGFMVKAHFAMNVGDKFIPWDEWIMYNNRQIGSKRMSNPTEERMINIDVLLENINNFLK
jgi:hypothetical protein